MPPRVPTRTVRLRQPRMPAHTERMQLLIYPMAMAQHGVTLPLIKGHNTAAAAAAGGVSMPPTPPSVPSARTTSGAMENAPGGGGVGMSGSASHEEPATNLPAPRRWVRDADELCIASIHRSNNINRINSYVATYKFDDPQWRPMLLPEVLVLPKPAHAAQQDGRASAGTSSAASTSEKVSGFDVFIDYSKLTTLELVSRHANYALRHLVQKGHAMYLVNFAQHSILQMRGLVEASCVTCAFGIRGERLRTHIVHTGPVDVRDIMEIDPRTQHVTFNFKKPNVRRGVVAVSTVEGYGTWFQRKPMLWQRTRRIGALQSQMGSYDYQLCDPASVGRRHSHEVSLLAPHVRRIGAQGGAEAIALVASSQVAQNDRLYMGQFEAPVLTAVDAVQQLAHHSALHHQLIRPAVSDNENDAAVADSDGAEESVGESPQLQEQRRLAGMERLLPVSWVTRTPPPYVPLESDLPFRIQLSQPAVFRTDVQKGLKDSSTAGSVIFPTGGSVGSPFVTGVPLSLHEYIIHQGVDHYIFDDAPSARPLKWWNQKSNMPYNGYMYAMRSGLLDHVEAAETIANPLAPPSTGKSATAASVKSARRRRRRHTHARRGASTPAAPAATTEGSETVGAAEEGSEDALSDDASEMPLHLDGEDLAAGAEELTGHEGDARQTAALQWAEEGKEVSTGDRPPLHALVAPNSAAQGRLRRYAQRGAPADATLKKKKSAAATPAGEESESVSSLPLEDRAGALLQRRLRLRRLRHSKREAEKTSEEAAVMDRPEPEKV